MQQSANSLQNLSESIKEKALEMGFAACGIAKAEELTNEKNYVDAWLQNGYQAEMAYMERNADKRLNPCLLEDGTKSVIVVLVPYYSELKQDTQAPRIARYAQTIDYHEPIRQKLYELLTFIKESANENVSGRAFTDSAPVLERAWAIKAGLGWQGKNGMLINKKLGSYFFIGELLINIDLEYDKPFTQNFCGECSRCIQACPTQAIVKQKVINARDCISYKTIEQKQNTSNTKLHGRVFGCDICQEVCPWNNKRTSTAPKWLPLIEYPWPTTIDEWKMMDEKVFKEKYNKSALFRTGYKRFIQNLDLL